MIYAFRRVFRGGRLARELTDLEYDMADAPGIGSKVRRGGKTYQRMPSLRAEIHVDAVCDEPFISRQLPRNYIPHKQAGGRFDSKGRCIFDTKTQIRKTQGKANDYSEHDQMRYPELEPFRSRS